MKVHCEWCKIEIERNIFCTPNHKKYFHMNRKRAAEKPRVFSTEMCSKHRVFKGSCGCDDKSAV